MKIKKQSLSNNEIVYQLDGWDFDDWMTTERFLDELIDNDYEVIIIKSKEIGEDLVNPKKQIKEYMREIIKTRSAMEYSTTREDLFNRVEKNFKNLDLLDFNEWLKELLNDGEIFEKFKEEYLWLE